MRMIDLVEPSENRSLLESAMRVYAKGKDKTTGRDKVVMKYRCLSGPRKGKTVSKPEDCMKRIDIKKRMVLKRTKAAKGKMMARRRLKTMKTNPTSKVVRAMNRNISRGRKRR